jgi:hypothetical protein
VANGVEKRHNLGFLYADQSHRFFSGKISVPSELLRALRMSGNGNVQLCRPENDEDQECVKLAASV